MQCLHTQFKHPRINLPGIQKILLKNIDHKTELSLIKQKQYNLYSFVQGYHAYMTYGHPKLG